MTPNQRAPLAGRSFMAGWTSMAVVWGVSTDAPGWAIALSVMLAAINIRHAIRELVKP